MKTRFLVIIGIILTGIILQLPLAFSHTIYPTPEEFYNSSDLIVLGKILSYDDIQQDRKYVVEIKEYVKKPENYDETKTINVFGCNPHPTSGSAIVGCQTFEKDQNIFFGISQNNDGKLFASYGFVVQNPNCTGEQLVQTVNQVTSLSVLQNNKSSPLFTGTKTDIVYDFVNLDLFSKNFTAQFKLNHGFPASANNTFYETKQVLVPECISPFSISASFIPTESGLYNASVTEENNSTLYIGGFSITEQNLSPLKQFKSGISIDKIQCKENLILIQKFDDSPACVTQKSAVALYDRGWTLKISANRDTPSMYLGPTDIPSANNQFALNFYSHVAQDKKSNVFFSPTSIFTAFAIVYEGAKGNTASEIKDVFGFDPDESKRRSSFANMQNHLNMNQQNNTISLANALWVAENFSVLPEYADTVKTYYESEIKSVDFSSKEKGVDVINSWIDEKTHGKIEKIFEELDPATKLVITNAIYFKGMWEESFDKTKTTVGNFHVSSDNTVQVPMMESKTTFPNVAVNDLVKIVELPYQGEKFSMLILLPKDVDGMDSLEESLSVDNLNKWKGELRKMQTKVHMPKFKLETEYDLKSVLHDMGIYDAFDNADFTGISNSGLHIEKAVHKAFVEVNEEGTEAAAATGIAMLESGPLEFTVDRPFIFIIQDNETGSILFIGKVVDPLQ
jgi:serpin B